jgi:sensor domain CHASE-containing protein
MGVRLDRMVVPIILASFVLSIYILVWGIYNMTRWHAHKQERDARSRVIAVATVKAVERRAIAVEVVTELKNQGYIQETQ